jgi:chaperonin GroEL
MEHKKIKSPAKIVRSRNDPRLRKCVLETVQLCADVVGGTLGPHGRPVLIERPEWSLPPLVTKDGVTVFRSLGLPDPVAHCIMEVARDPAVRTAIDAGDGTTTATILMAAIVKGLDAWCSEHPSDSPQAIVRDMHRVYREILSPELLQVTLPCSLDDTRDRTFAVARLSANGDGDLAKAVLEAFDICGDAGTVTIAEDQGPSSYSVEHVKGFPVATGFERDCGRMFPVFLNNAGSRVTMDNPVFLLHFGSIHDAHAITPVLSKYAEAVKDRYATQTNIVVVATGWSPSALDYLSKNWVESMFKIYPMLVPFDTPVHNAQRHFLDDLAAVTGAEVFDPATKPLEGIVGFSGLGNLMAEEDAGGFSMYRPGGVTSFQADRWTSSIFGSYDEELLLARHRVVASQVARAVSEVDRVYIPEPRRRPDRGHRQNHRGRRVRCRLQGTS